jgi:ATP-dependent Clp protease ATP-binding subunit ClpA
MSEYQEKHSISKLIGSPPGYVGFGESTGLLINGIQENPNAILLLDEVEKSHPDVTTILLQIMDNGFVTGSTGKQVDCRNLVVILTTNAGAQSADKNNIGFGNQEKEHTDVDLKKFFTPEFRNRLDGIITFNKLDKDTMRKVVDKFINELRNQVKEKSVRIKIDTSTINWLIEKGFDTKMGARPLQRVIDTEIKRTMAKMMLFGDLKDGGVLNITIEDDAINLIAKSKRMVGSISVTDTLIND